MRERATRELGAIVRRLVRLSTGQTCAAALLVVALVTPGIGGSVPRGVRQAPQCPPSPSACPLAPNPMTFPCTLRVDQWTVPPGIRWVVIELLGAQGGSASAGGYAVAGGRGALVRVFTAVRPGDHWQVKVGCAGDDSRHLGGTASGGYGGASGANGGGTGGGGGGGASALDFRAVTSICTGCQAWAIAGGGGGSGENVCTSSSGGPGGGGGAGGAGGPAPPGGFSLIGPPPHGSSHSRDCDSRTTWGSGGSGGPPGTGGLGGRFGTSRASGGGNSPCSACWSSAVTGGAGAPSGGGGGAGAPGGGGGGGTGELVNPVTFGPAGCVGGPCWAAGGGGGGGSTAGGLAAPPSEFLTSYFSGVMRGDGEILIFYGASEGDAVTRFIVNLLAGTAWRDASSYLTQVAQSVSPLRAALPPAPPAPPPPSTTLPQHRGGPPADTTPPTVDSLGVSPNPIYEYCASPPNPTTATVSWSSSDPDGPVQSVTVSWSGAGTSGSTTGGASGSVSIGPFPAMGTVAVTAAARDAAGNTGSGHTALTVQQWPC